jgi:Na+-translocating ferredoxin:NAD+ oxidoreductase subunit G
VRDILKLGIVLMVYSVIAGASLAYVNLMTKEKVASNKTLAEELARKEVLPGMEGGFDLKGKMAVGSYEFPWWIGYTDQAKSSVGGYVFIAKGKGYSSVIETMVGVGKDFKITGIKVVFQQETPGLGTKITEIKYGENDPWFYRQFKGKSVEDNLKVKKDGGTIDAMTGATISPRAVTDSINKGLTKLKEAAGGSGS